MSLSPIGSAVFELLSHKHTDRHTDRQTDRHHITLEYRLYISSPPPPLHLASRIC